MKISVFLSFTLISVVLTGCNSSSNSLTPKAKLLFSSGFEGNVVIENSPYDDYKFITGTDSETGFTWPLDILGAKESGLHYINENSYQTITSEIQTVLGHKNKPTKALYSSVTCDNGVKNCENGDTQNPYEILDIKNGKQSLYVKYWIKLDADSLNDADTWRTFFEWKTKDYSKGTGFRLISYIYTDDNGTPYWHWQGDHDPDALADWEFDNKDIPVPLNDWFKTEFYWSWDEGDGGRALWKINDKVVKDHLGPKTLPSQGIDFIMLTQIYGDANPKHQWIDDIEVWDGLPNE